MPLQPGSEPDMLLQPGSGPGEGRQACRYSQQGGQHPRPPPRGLCPVEPRAQVAYLHGGACHVQRGGF